MVTNNWEFLYVWGTQGLIALMSFALGMVYQILKKKEAGG